MKLKYIILLTAAVISFGVTATAKRHQHRRDNKSIVILFDNDVHCAIDGYARMAGLRDAVRDTAHCLMVSCGDYLQGGPAGAISRGRYVIDIMKEMQYDVITLGNHEFDFGTPRQQELMAYYGRPVTCVNLRRIDTKELLYAPYIINKVGGHKIAFVGVLTPTAIYTEKYGFVDEQGHETLELAPKEVYQLVEDAALAARRKGAEYVFVLSHLGEDTNVTGIQSHDLIRRTKGIDAIFDGHTHSVVKGEYLNNREGKPVLICETGSQFANIGKCLIDRKGRISAELIPTQTVTQRSQRIVEVTDSIKTLYETEINRVIGHSEVIININNEDGTRRVRNNETNAGDLVSDAFRYVSGAQISITNAGGIRTSIPAGDITYGNILSIQPFNNSLCTVDVKGETIIRLLKACTSFLPLEHGDFPIVSGIRFCIDTSSDERIKQVEVLDNKTGNYYPIVPEDTYLLGTTDYCVTGGGLMGILKEHKLKKAHIMSDNEALMTFITQKLKGNVGQEYAKPQQRITFK